MRQMTGALFCVCALSVMAESDLTTLHSGGTVTGSASLSSYPPSNAFDDVEPVSGGTLGRWLALISGSGSYPAWVQYRFPNNERYVVGRYIVVNSTYSTTWLTRAPKDFSLSGSTNGTDWVTLDTRSGETGWAEAEARTYFVSDKSTAYEYFKLSVTANNGDPQYMGIHELELYEPPATLPTAPTYLTPTNGAVDVSVNGFLHWDNDALTVSNIVYMGTNATLTEADLLGTTTDKSIYYTSLVNSTPYYWMVVSANDNGVTTGEVWQFTTFMELPDLVAYEGFETYATGILDGKGAAGSGWTEGWTAATSEVQVVTESLRYSGGAVLVNGGTQAVHYGTVNLSPLILRGTIPIGYGAAYISLLVKGQGMQNDVHSFVLRDMNYTGGPDGIPHSLGMDFARGSGDSPPGYIDAEVYGTSDRRRGLTTVAPTNNVTYFVVVRLTRSANNEYETAAVIVNPTSATEPLTGWASTNFTDCAAMTLDAFAVRAAVMDAGDWITFDEVRIGTTYEAVVPIRGVGTMIRIF